MKKFNNCGFGLIESLISILLLAVVITSGLYFYFNSQKLVVLTSHKNVATHIANAELEAIRTKGYSYAGLPANGNTKNCADATLNPEVDIKLGNLPAGSFSCTVKVVYVDEPADGTNPDYKRVELTYSWTDIGFGSRTIQLITYLAP